MALTEKSIIDKVEVVGGDTDWVHVQIRTKNTVLKDGIEISSSYHRDVYGPAFDVDSIPDADVKAVCQLYLTAERKAAYYAAYPSIDPKNRVIDLNRFGDQ